MLTLNAHDGCLKVDVHGDVRMVKAVKAIITTERNCEIVLIKRQSGDLVYVYTYDIGWSNSQNNLRNVRETYDSHIDKFVTNGYFLLEKV